MAMRTYGIETKGMVLNCNELEKLIVNNKETVNQDYFIDFDCIEFSEMTDFIYEILNACFVCEFEGYLVLDTTEELVELDTDIFLFELDKNTLFEKYENIEEIYNELIDKFKGIGIKIDIDYIKDHFGRINGSYIA